MKAPVLKSYGSIEWAEAETPRVSESTALVKVSAASICGSDEHVFRGDFHPRTKLPFIQGHEFAGTVIDIGKEIEKIKSGDRVAVDPIFWCGKCAACEKGHHQACKSLKLLGIDVNGGFGEYVLAEEFMLYKLPDTISDRHAALIELFSIGFHACNRSGIAENDTAVIFGAGKIGQAILQGAMNRTKNRLFIVDILKSRLDIAAKVNDKVKVIDASKADPVEVIMDETNGRGTDIAFEAVGHAAPMEGRPHPVRQCVQAIRQGGTVCVLGLADEPVPIVMRELIFKEAKIVTSRVTAGEFAESIDCLSKGLLKPEPLITGELPASRLQEGFERLAKAPEKDLKILITPGV